MDADQALVIGLKKSFTTIGDATEDGKSPKALEARIVRAYEQVAKAARKRNRERWSDDDYEGVVATALAAKLCDYDDVDGFHPRAVMGGRLLLVIEAFVASQEKRKLIDEQIEKRKALCSLASRRLAGIRNEWLLNSYRTRLPSVHGSARRKLRRMISKLASRDKPGWYDRYLSSISKKALSIPEQERILTKEERLRVLDVFDGLDRRLLRKIGKAVLDGVIK